MSSTVLVLDKARTAWGGDIPEWVEALARACNETSQVKVARRVGYSAATVSYVLANRYVGDMAAVEQAVRATIMAATITCPELGELALTDCLEWRRRSQDFQATSSLRTRMFNVCRVCERNGGR